MNYMKCFLCHSAANYHVSSHVTEYIEAYREKLWYCVYNSTTGGFWKRLVYIFDPFFRPLKVKTIIMKVIKKKRDIGRVC